MKQLVARANDDGRRLDVIVAELYPDFSRSSLELLFDKGLIEVDGHPAKAGHKLRAGETINIGDSYLKQKPPAVKLPILYEDNDVIVIDKPAGILTHSKGGLNLEASVASFIQPKLSDKELVGNRAGIVHRLDRLTSGVIITAKNLKSQKYLQKQFSLRRVKKNYVAIVEGVPELNQAVIDAPIARNPKKPQRFMVSPVGRSALTEYHVGKGIIVAGKQYAKIELRPQTGRTHQLRVHMAYIGHPIVGDPVCGHGPENLMLHASELELTLPTGKRRLFKSKLPPRFRIFEKDAKKHIS